MPPSNEPTQPTDSAPDPIKPTSVSEQPVSPPTQSVPPAAGRPKWPLIIAIVAVVLVIAGAVTYFFVLKPSAQPSASTQNESSSTKVTSLTTTNSPNNANGTVSFTHPASWKVTKETDQYGTESTIITSPLGNRVKMYTRDSVGGSCTDDTDTYTLVKKITTQNASYVFTEYKFSASSSSLPEVLRLETYYDKKSAAHRALTEGQSGTNVCKNVSGYPIAKDINVTIENSSMKEATYNDVKADTAFITMLQSFSVTDN